MKRTILCVLTPLLVILCSAPQSAAASSTTPKSMRGYYIGNHHLLHLTKHNLYEGAPQADIYSYHIRRVVRHGKNYHFYTRFTLGDTTYPTLKLKKVGYHKIRLVGMATVHKVSKAHYSHYNFNGY